MASMEFEVKPKLTVSLETAEACLRLVQIFIHENNLDIVADKQPDGTYWLSFRRKNASSARHKRPRTEVLRRYKELCEHDTHNPT